MIQHQLSASSNSTANMLVIDDNELNRHLLTMRLQGLGYNVASVEDGEAALKILNEQNFDLLLLDVMMPGMSGYQVLEQLKGHNRLRHIPVIMISALDEMNSVVKCIELGAEDYLPKPINPVILKARVGACLDKKRLHDQEELQRQQLEHLVREQVLEIASAQLAAIFAMSKLAESKDPETGAHLERLREYCKVLATHMAGNEKYAQHIDTGFIDSIYTASPLHDIGKVGIPDNILLKPGSLTKDEWVIMRKHTLIGADTLRAVDKLHPGNAFIRMGIDIAAGHHEKWDGSGYPHNLQGEAIPLAARILALGDVYDALTSVRCYKAAFTHDESRNIILEGSGKHFDPSVVETFLATEDEFLRIRAYFQEPDE